MCVCCAQSRQRKNVIEDLLQNIYKNIVVILKYSIFKKRITNDKTNLYFNKVV